MQDDGAEAFGLYNFTSLSSYMNLYGTDTFNRGLFIRAEATFGDGEGTGTSYIQLTPPVHSGGSSSSNAGVSVYPRLKVTSGVNTYPQALYVNGDVRIDGTVYTVATGGSYSVPSNAVGFLAMNINGTNYKIPYFS